MRPATPWLWMCRRGGSFRFLGVSCVRLHGRRLDWVVWALHIMSREWVVGCGLGTFDTFFYKYCVVYIYTTTTSRLVGDGLVSGFTMLS